MFPPYHILESFSSSSMASCTSYICNIQSYGTFLFDKHTYIQHINCTMRIDSLGRGGVSQDFNLCIQHCRIDSLGRGGISQDFNLCIQHCRIDSLGRGGISQDFNLCIQHCRIDSLGRGGISLDFNLCIQHCCNTPYLHLHTSKFWE